MDSFFNWVTSSKAVTLVLLSVVGLVVIILVTIFLVAFFQGRSISFWPPKIGQKTPKQSKDRVVDKIKIESGNKEVVTNQKTIIIISKEALYNLWCETIQRICYVFVDNASISINDIRVSLFRVDIISEDYLGDSDKEINMVGRFPQFSNILPQKKYSLGEGTSGIAARDNVKIIQENLPIWENNKKAYIDVMKEKYNLKEITIKSWTIKSRCYYALPIEYNNFEKGFNEARFVISIDSILPTLASKNTESKVLISIINEFVCNQRQLLIDGYSDPKK